MSARAAIVLLLLWLVPALALGAPAGPAAPGAITVAAVLDDGAAGAPAAEAGAADGLRRDGTPDPAAPACPRGAEAAPPTHRPVPPARAPPCGDETA